jgi:hypothetical protein
MKNVKKFFAIAIVAVTTSVLSMVATPVSAQQVEYTYHSLIKPELEGTLTGEQMKEKVEELYLQPSHSLEESIFQLGDDFARKVYDHILNKDFGKGRELSSAEKATIISRSVCEPMPADFATNPSYEGRVERYKADGTVSTWIRAIEEGDKWLKYDGKPFLLVRCANGYELKTLSWTRSESNTGPTATATADVHVVIDDNRSSAPSAAPASYGNACGIESFTASRLQIKCGESSKLIWRTDCSYVNIDPLTNRFRPSGSVMVQPTESTQYTLTTSSGSTAIVKVDVSHWFGRNAAWVVPGGLAVIGGGIYLFTHHSAAHDNAYDNGFQGGSGASGAQGGQGSQQTFSLRLPAGVGLGAMKYVAPNGQHRSTLGLNFAMHL